MSAKKQFLNIYPLAYCEKYTGLWNVLAGNYVVYIPSEKSGVRTIEGWGASPQLAWKHAFQMCSTKMIAKLKS